MVYIANPIARAASPDFDLFSKHGQMKNKTLHDKIVRASQLTCYTHPIIHQSYLQQCTIS